MEEELTKTAWERVKANLQMRLACHLKAVELQHEIKGVFMSFKDASELSEKIWDSFLEANMSEMGLFDSSRIYGDDSGTRIDI